MANTLVVISPFGAHATGDEITDTAEIEAVLNERPHAVVRKADKAAVEPAVAPAHTQLEEPHE